METTIVAQGPADVSVRDWLQPEEFTPEPRSIVEVHIGNGEFVLAKYDAEYGMWAEEETGALSSKTTFEWRYRNVDAHWRKPVPNAG